jgi:MYXO-CTERM domain-containing protein
MSYSQTALTLTEGRYVLSVAYSMGNGSSHTGTLIDFAVVPAPGAAALIGMAGVLAGRRRRN